MTVISKLSVFALAALLAPRIELFADSQPRHRPVMVLLLDEFSAGSAQNLVASLAGRDLKVESWSIPSIGFDTGDVIPAIFSGAALGGARECTSTAICGTTRVVDFSRMRVDRDDVDIVGIFHRYCVIEGLRYCINPELGFEGPLSISFLCALPLRFLLDVRLGCNRGQDAVGADASATARREMFRAPFWSRGGLLYAHLRLPHPPSPSGEPRLADAYAANIERAGKLVSSVVDGLEKTPFRDDFTLVVVSDHHLRSQYWCKTEPYSSHDCELPESMRSEDVPFIIATRGAAVEHSVPRSNVDLLPIVVELSKGR